MDCRKKSMKKEMGAFKRKKLADQKGKKVKGRKQALAIALSRTESKCGIKPKPVPPAVKDKILYIRARAYANKSYKKSSQFKSAYLQRKYAQLYREKYGPDSKPFDLSKRRGGLDKFFKTKYSREREMERRKKLKGVKSKP